MFAAWQIVERYQETVAASGLLAASILALHLNVPLTDLEGFVEGRIIDLSLAAARKIGLEVDGVAPVRLRVVDARRDVGAEANRRFEAALAEVK